MNPQPVAINNLSLRQYKSIEHCDFELGPLTVLVGRNGVGKSNILDALAFVTDSLRNTLEYALRSRGGIAQVRRKSASKPTTPGVSLDLTLPDGSTAKYTFGISTVQGAVFRVRNEECVVTPSGGSASHRFELRDNELKRWSPSSTAPPPSLDRLFLVAASGFPEFRPVYDILTRMVFHNLNPEAMKAPRRPEPGSLMARDGSNLASVIKQLAATAPDKLDRVLDYIRAIGVPIKKIEHKQAGSLETFQVLQERGEGSREANFEAIALSDGTIRALGILVSLVSVGPEGTAGPSLIGIEEPETALHPAASHALMDALTEGCESTQIIVTCHSPDLLDHQGLNPEMIRPVILEDGGTRVGVLSPKKKQLLQSHLATPGELLRLDQFEPDPDDLRRQEEARGTFWESMT